MKVALVHDYIKEYGGAERVLESLHEIWPKAPVFTSVYLPNFLGPHRSRFEDWDIRTSVLQNIPFKAKLISPLRLIAPLIFKFMDLSSYDVIIVSATGAYETNLVKKGKAKLICYYHTPPRYLYGYETARDWKKHRIFAFFAEIANHFLRIVDFSSSQNVDIAIANSNEVKARIWKFYKKDAVTVYPPVEGDKRTKEHNLPAQAKSKSESYYVAGGRLARAKRIDLAILAANKLGIKLKIFGRGFANYENYLKSIAGSTVEFLGEINDEQKWEVLGNAKAYISPSMDEDFGILNVEAMLTGTPVIAHKSGGSVETIIEGKTGTFFNIHTDDDLVKALKRFQKMKISSNICIVQAKKFSKETFKTKMKNIVDKEAKHA